MRPCRIRFGMISGNSLSLSKREKLTMRTNLFDNRISITITNGIYYLNNGMIESTNKRKKKKKERRI